MMMMMGGGGDTLDQHTLTVHSKSSHSILCRFESLEVSTSTLHMVTTRLDLDVFTCVPLYRERSVYSEGLMMVG